MANAYGHIITGNNELIKQYFVYDAGSRLITVYEARADAPAGTPCLKTDYTYDDTSTRVLKMKESESTWDATWDI